MKMFNLMLAGLVIGTIPTIEGCAPRTTGQKVEDKAEDAAHEAHQGVKRAKENVEDATR